VESLEEGQQVAGEIGFPVIIKAAAGGGGKGMRVANDVDQFTQSFTLAKQEALAAFNSDEVYIEKYLARPRHNRDSDHGRHARQGDASVRARLLVQRRHQKLVRKRHRPRWTRRCARTSATRGEARESIGYVGAGTIR